MVGPYWRPAGTDQYGLMLSAFMSWPGSHIVAALGSTVPDSLFFATAPILIPLRFVTLSIMGAAGGLVSGFATDLNVVIWNFDHPLENLSRPFRTNAKKPE